MKTKSVSQKRRAVRERLSSYRVSPLAQPLSTLRVVRRSRWPRGSTARQRTAISELVRRLHSEYPDRILAMVLFGSVARGDFTPDSDIDILIVADRADPDFEWKVSGIGARVSLECDVIFNLHVYSQDLWKTLQSARRTLWRNVKREGIQLSLRPRAA